MPRAAASPICIASLTRLKLADEMLPRSGAIRTSRLPRLAICLSTVALPRKLMSCSTTASAEPSSSRFIAGVPMFTAMITSAHISRTRSIGRLFAIPPSTRRCPCISTGATAPGIDMLARHDVCRHRAKWDRQLGEVRDFRRRLGEIAQEALDRNASDHALRQHELEVLEAEL